MDKIQNKCKEIINLVCNCTTIEDIGLFNGISGTSLFLFYSGRYFKNNNYTEKGFDLLKKGIDSIAEDSTYDHTFCNGLSGFGWTFNHLANHEFIDAEENQIEDLDTPVFNAAINDIDNLLYDYLHGSIGVGLYLVMKKNISEKNNLYLNQIIEKLYAIRIESDEGICWHDNLTLLYQKKKNENGRFNLGMAHGLPSIIIFLCKCYERKLHFGLTKRMIEGAIKFIKNQKIPSHIESVSLYPAMVDKGEGIKPNSRLGWCYGDLGIASCMWQVGKTLNNEELKKESIEIMLHASHRKELTQNMILDAGACHGTASISHVFNRFYIETKMPIFKKCSSYWINQTLKMVKHEDGLAGFKFWNGEENKWKNNYNLLEGITGIGLVLLSHIYGKESMNWDECLLLS